MMFAMSSQNVVFHHVKRQDLTGHPQARLFQKYQLKLLLLVGFLQQFYVQWQLQQGF